MRLYDITRTISPTLAVFPGDTPFSAQRMLSLANGDSVNLFALTMTAHCGTHADAVYHYSDAGIHPDQLPLERYLGAAQVVHISRTHGGITPDDLSGIDLRLAPRLLFRTRASVLTDDQWDGDFVHPTPELVDYAADQGVFLVGVDTPSVDHPSSKTLPTHRRMYERDIVILENIMLRDVPMGVYELIALPLKIAGVCGTPIRAVLRG
ncbi:MAG TPA: cyclase family protein [Aggregatilineales bacterium]|nr:cyclase family protein [Anaerolineales bacterium]HRE46285.1 cyclase family protein [Aggregatilineales bacterium]